MSMYHTERDSDKDDHASINNNTYNEFDYELQLNLLK